MSAREVFGVVVRCAGLVAVLYGLYSIASGVAAVVAIGNTDRSGLFGSPSGMDGRVQWTGPLMQVAGILGGVCIVTGLLLMRGAGVVERFSYAGREQAQKAAPTESSLPEAPMAK
jgi:hypothetical protein